MWIIIACCYIPKTWWHAATKASGAERGRFLWSAPEPTVEWTTEVQVIWCVTLMEQIQPQGAVLINSNFQLDPWFIYQVWYVTPTCRLLGFTYNRKLTIEFWSPDDLSRMQYHAIRLRLGYRENDSSNSFNRIVTMQQDQLKYGYVSVIPICFHLKGSETWIVRLSYGELLMILYVWSWIGIWRT